MSVVPGQIIRLRDVLGKVFVTTRLLSSYSAMGSMKKGLAPMGYVPKERPKFGQPISDIVFSHPNPTQLVIGVSSTGIRTLQCMNDEIPFELIEEET